MMDRIEIVNLTLIPGDRPLKAIGSVRIGNLTIHGFRIVQEDGARAAVLMPQATMRGEDGRIKYQSLLSMPGEIRQLVEAELISAWQREIQNGFRPPR